jgi:hypothetical protein
MDTIASCCGWPRRIVSVELLDQNLHIEICDLCFLRQWFLNGSAISPDAAVNLALALDALVA